MTDTEAIKNCVMAGLGISIVSKKAAKKLIEQQNVLSFEFEKDSSGRKFYIIYRRDFQLKSFIHTFIDYIKNYYKTCSN